MEGTRRRRTRKAVWDPTEDTRPQWREALTTRVLERVIASPALLELLELSLLELLVLSEPELTFPRLRRSSFIRVGSFLSSNLRRYTTHFAGRSPGGRPNRSA